jgi:hypothetical protein
MGDAAQGEPRQHEVFNTPFKVKPVFESWPTPGNYRGYPGGKDLPDKIKVWRIQNTGKDFGSVASYSYGFEDSPDAEILTPGFNVGKESGAVGVGRHGNFLQWGFSAPPSQMTEPGRQFFLNCICYIRKFDGVRPIVRVQSSDRLTAVHLAMLMTRIKDPSFRTNTFPAELLEKFKDDSNGMARYYQDHFELIYYQRGFHIDADLSALGLKSNRKVETLQRVIELLGDPAQAPAARKVLGRYTRESFETPDQWQAWFKENRDRLFFSDVGGYKFFVKPMNYPVRPL